MAEETVNFFDTVFTRLDDEIIKPIVFKTWTSLTNTFSDEITLLAVIALSVAALMIMSGRAGFGSYAMRVIVVVIVFRFLGDWEFTARYVYDVFTYANIEFTEAIMSAYLPNVDAYAGLNDMMNQVIDVCSKIWERMDWGVAAVYWGLVGVGYFLVGAGLLVFVAATLVLAKIGIAIMLMLFPLAVLTLLTQTTAGAFGGWLKGIVGLALIPIFYTAGLVFTMMLIGEDIKLLNEQTENLKFVDIVANAFILCICMAVFFKLSKLIEKVAGGITLDGASIYKRIQQSTVHVVSHSGAAAGRLVGRLRNRSETS